MKIAVCDDDKAAREHIVSLIKEQIQDAEIVTFENGEDMLRSQDRQWLLSLPQVLPCEYGEDRFL